MRVRQRFRWRAQVLLLIMIAVLAITGLINWILPHGPAARSIRYPLRWLHEGAALGFLVLLAAHLHFHWDALQRNLRRFGFWGGEAADPPARRSRGPAEKQSD